MVSRLIKYIFTIYFCLLTNAIAGTDLLANGLTQSNIFLKEAGNVQREYSKQFRKLATMKINPDALLGEQGKAIKEKAEKAIDKANSLKEKAEKIKKVAEQAQAEGAALMEKYNKLNEQAAELKAQADETLAQGLEIRDKYKTGRAQLEEALDTAKDLKDGLRDEEDNETDGESVDNNGADDELSAEEIEDVEPTEVAVEKDTGFRKVVGSKAIQNTPELVSSVSVPVEKAFASIPLSAETNDVSIKIPSYNQADAISSAGSMAKQVGNDTSTIAIETDINIDIIDQNTVSVSDVMTAVNNPETITSLPKANNNIRTAQSLEEQLGQVSNYTPAVVNKNNQEKAKIIDKEDSLGSKLGVRTQFKEVSNDLVNNKKELTVEEKAND